MTRMLGSRRPPCGGKNGVSLGQFVGLGARAAKQRAMNVAIFLDDVNEFNGPLMFITGSHKKGVIDAKHDLTTTSYPLWTVDHALITQLVARAGGKQGGIMAPKARRVR